MCGESEGISLPQATATLHCTQIEFKASIHASRSERSNEKMDRSKKESMHLEVGAQVVGPSLAALLAHPAGERLRYHRPLPVAVLHHHLPEDSAKRATTDRASARPAAGTRSAATTKHSPCTESKQKGTRKKKEQKNENSGEQVLTRPPPRSRGPCGAAPYARRCHRPRGAAAAAEPRSRRRAGRWT